MKNQIFLDNLKTSYEKKVIDTRISLTPTTRGYSWCKCARRNLNRRLQTRLLICNCIDPPSTLQLANARFCWPTLTLCKRHSHEKSWKIPFTVSHAIFDSHRCDASRKPDRSIAQFAYKYVVRDISNRTTRLSVR